MCLGNCVCTLCVCDCVSVCVCLSVFEVSMCPHAPVPQLSTGDRLSPVGLCLRALKPSFLCQGMESNAQVAQELGGVW